MTQTLRYPIDAVLDVLMGRDPVTVTFSDGTAVAGFAVRVEETPLGQWLVLRGDDGDTYRVSVAGAARIEWGRW